MKKTFLLLAFISLHLTAFCQSDLSNIMMVYVKGGSFFMGCDDTKFTAKEYDNERPLHRVTVSSFYIQKYEVTNGQWRQLFGIYPPAYNGVNYVNKDCDDCPVVMVSWDDVQEFIKRLNQKFPNRHYRLVTETEWEYAARGGKYAGNFMYAGSNKIKDVAWYGKPEGATHPIGQKKPNELSIYDLSGNVLEWCADWYADDYYKNTIDAINPKGPATGDTRVLRGGSYFTDDISCRTVFRSHLDPATRRWDIGFRLAYDAPSEETGK